MGFLRGLIDALTGRSKKPVVEEPPTKPPAAAPAEEVAEPEAVAPAEEMAKPEAAPPVEEVAEEPVPEAEPGDFTTIRGVGAATQKKLNEAGIVTYAQLSQATPEKLEEITGRPAARIVAEGWISAAEKLAKKS